MSYCPHCKSRVCQPLQIRKWHPCNKCGEPIASGSKVYKHSGYGRTSKGKDFYSFFYVCESCHMFIQIAEETCSLDRKTWEPKVFELEGKPFLRFNNQLSAIEDDVRCVLIRGKLVWESESD